MALGATLFVFIAILVGALLLTDLAPSGGLRALVGGHVALALAASVLVFVAALSASASLEAAAAVALVVTGSIGVLTWRRSLARPGAKGASGALLVIHGAAAALSIVLIALAAGHA
jgi:hypothetical protein